MRKEAIGIAINGREVKVALVYRDKNRLGVDFLETSTFTKDVDSEQVKKDQRKAETTIIEEEDIFSARNPVDTKSPLENETGIRENTDVLYSLLSKFASKKIKVAFNISPSRVTYQDLDTQLDYNKNLFKGKLQKKINSWKQGFNELDNVSVITRRDGSLCNVFCETYQPPIVDILNNLNTYFKGNLQLSLMDSNDVSLINLARIGYDFRSPHEITIIIEIETEFSRIIFMQGEDLLMVSPIINESFNPDIISIIYSKIIYELDNSNVPEISNILLAGRASSASARSFFEKKFPDARVGFILSQPLADNLSSQFSREDLANYAIPISLAWKTIENDKDNFIQTNLLPTQIIDRHKVLSLSMAGYVLLVLLGITAFIMTWKITAKKLEVGNIKRQNYSLQEQIFNSESTVNRVHQIEDEISKLTKRIELSDSLSLGSDRLLTFLDNLNQSVSRIRSVWIEEVSNTKTGILIKGMSLKRGDVPRISEELGGTKIRKLTRTGSKNSRLYYFEMEIDWGTQPPLPGTDKLFKPEKVKPVRTVSNNPKPVKSSSAGWGTTTTATQTIIAEQDVEDDENVIYIATQKNENAVSHNNAEKIDRLATEEIPSNETQNFKKYDSKNKIGSRVSPEMSLDSAGRAAKDHQIDNSLIRKANHTLAPEEEKYEENQNPTQYDSGTYCVRISAHVTRFTAQKEVEQFRKKGYNAYITRLPNSSRDIPYSVCYGNFNNYNKAQQKLNELTKVISRKYDIIKIKK